MEQQMDKEVRLYIIRRIKEMLDHLSVLIERADDETRETETAYEARALFSVARDFMGIAEDELSRLSEHDDKADLAFDRAKAMLCLMASNDWEKDIETDSAACTAILRGIIAEAKDCASKIEKRIQGEGRAEQ